MMLRASVGFLFFLLAFWLRDADGRHGLVRRWPSRLSALGTMVGNAVAPGCAAASARS